MGVHSELFVSTRGKALRFEKHRERAAPPAYVRVESRGLMPVEFAALWAILLHEPYEPSRHQLENLYFGTPRDTRLGRMRRKLLMWKAVVQTLRGRDVANSGLYRFPPGYVRTLAALDDPALATAAAAWSGAEGGGCPGADDAQAVLLELRRLAALAESTRRQLFLWGTTAPRPDAAVDQTGPGES
jgi:hypothetical protein